MKKLHVDVADSSAKRERGLMGCKHLSKNYGMLFSFSRTNHLQFWMRNTYVPLDIAFLNENGIITQISEMIPLTTKPVISSYPCKYALEVNRGWFLDNGIDVGSRIGGEGISKKEIKLAQVPAMDLFPSQEMNSQMEFQQPQQPEVQSPDVMLNKSYKQILEDAQIRAKDLVVLYQTKDGIDLPPKVISPPYTFDTSAEGKHDGVVTGWDNQTGGWKSFLIDNIMSLDYKDEVEIKNSI
jgi:uncharacterized membrane protein (UPF0127 family)